MELQSRPEALAVELARRQNGDLRKRFPERHRGSPRSATNHDKHFGVSNGPIRVPEGWLPALVVFPHGCHVEGASPGLNVMGAQRHPEEPAALGSITAVPVPGPQVSSLQRLAGQGVAVLPQVRPKTLIPDSLPVTPARDRPPQPPAFRKAAVVSAKNPSPALPTANNTVSHAPAPGGQPQALAEPAAVTSLSGAGVAYAVLPTGPGNAVSVVSDSVKLQPLLISTDSKVILLQPPVQAQPESEAEPRPPSEEPPPGAQAAKGEEGRPPSQEDPEKIAFMVALGLVTAEHLEEIQSKRQERKRRSAASPAYSGLLEPERKRLASSYLHGPLLLTARATEDPCWKSEIAHGELCAACQRGADLQSCSTCPRAYHLGCLDPPLTTAPEGVWLCPKCQHKALRKDESVPWTGMLAIVRSYLTHKTVKEEERRKLLQRGSELQSGRQRLEARDRRLASAVKKCLELKVSLLARQRGTQSSLDRLRALLRLIQGEQVRQVPPLPAGPWAKPSAAARHAQGHN